MPHRNGGARARTPKTSAWAVPVPEELASALPHQIIAHVRDVFWLSDPSKAAMLYVSPAYEAVWGRSVESLYASPRSFLDAIHDDDRAGVIAALPLQALGGYDVEYRIVRPDGAVRWIRDRAYPVADATGAVHRIAGVAQDVTERRRAQDELARRERWYRSLFEHTSDLVTVIDPAGQILFQSPSVARVLGHAADELAGGPARDLVHPDDRRRLAALLAGLERDRPVTASYRMRRRDGSFAYVEGVGARIVEPGGGEVVVVCARDVSASRLVDALTGLPSEALLRHELERRLELQGDRAPLALVLADVDGFAALNDAIGEPEADLVLREVARRLTEVAGGSLVARLTGDRFALLVDGVAEVGRALDAVRRVRDALGTPFVQGERELVLSAGYGIVALPPLGTSASDVIHAAGTALAAAKRMGRDHHEVFEASQRSRARDRIALEAALRAAIERGGIEVHYQPIVDLLSGRIAGFEALARWRRDGALIPPSAFIPIAEETGLVCALDLAVLREAARQLAAWRARHPELATAFVSVNLSARQFEHAGLVERVADAIAPAGVPPAAIKLEVTESALIAQPDEAARLIATLHARGFRFGLDDFGTGHSSLSYLHQFPFETLKIDRSFVSALGAAAGRPALVRGVVALAREMGLSVVAEGIETPDQLALLESLGCDLGQGYLLSRPLDAAGIEALLPWAVPGAGGRLAAG